MATTVLFVVALASSVTAQQLTAEDLGIDTSSVAGLIATSPQENKLTSLLQESRHAFQEYQRNVQEDDDDFRELQFPKRNTVHQLDTNTTECFTPDINLQISCATPETSGCTATCASGFKLAEATDSLTVTKCATGITQSLGPCLSACSNDWDVVYGGAFEDAELSTTTFLYKINSGSSKALSGWTLGMCGFTVSSPLISACQVSSASDALRAQTGVTGPAFSCAQAVNQQRDYFITVSGLSIPTTTCMYGMSSGSAFSVGRTVCPSAVAQPTCEHATKPSSTPMPEYFCGSSTCTLDPTLETGSVARHLTLTYQTCSYTTFRVTAYRGSIVTSTCVVDVTADVGSACPLLFASSIHAAGKVTADIAVDESGGLLSYQIQPVDANDNDVGVAAISNQVQVTNNVPTIRAPPVNVLVGFAGNTALPIPFPALEGISPTEVVTATFSLSGGGTSIQIDDANLPTCARIVSQSATQLKVSGTPSCLAAVWPLVTLSVPPTIVDTKSILSLSLMNAANSPVGSLVDVASVYSVAVPRAALTWVDSFTAPACMSIPIAAFLTINVTGSPNAPITLTLTASAASDDTGVSNQLVLLSEGVSHTYQAKNILILTGLPADLMRVFEDGLLIYTPACDNVLTRGATRRLSAAPSTATLTALLVDSQGESSTAVTTIIITGRAPSVPVAVPQQTAPAPVLASPPQSKESKPAANNNTIAVAVAVAVIVPLCCCIIICAAFLVILRRRRQSYDLTESVYAGVNSAEELPSAYPVKYLGVNTVDADGSWDKASFAPPAKSAAKTPPSPVHSKPKSQSEQSHPALDMLYRSQNHLVECLQQMDQNASTNALDLLVLSVQDPVRRQSQTSISSQEARAQKLAKMQTLLEIKAKLQAIKSQKIAQSKFRKESQSLTLPPVPAEDVESEPEVEVVPPENVSAPATPRSVAPTTPRAVAPATPRAVAPATPRAVAPATPRAVAPATPRAVAPVSPRSVAPVSPRSVAPVSPRSVAPVSPRSVAPVSPRSVAPASPRAAVLSPRVVTPVPAELQVEDVVESVQEEQAADADRPDLAKLNSRLIELRSARAAGRRESYVVDAIVNPQEVETLPSSREPQRRGSGAGTSRIAHLEHLEGRLQTVMRHLPQEAKNAELQQKKERLEKLQARLLEVQMRKAQMLTKSEDEG